MKKIFAIAIMFSSLTASANQYFVCRPDNGTSTVNLELSTYTAKLGSMEYRNMYPVDQTVDIRVYVHIGSPWQNLEIPKAMLDGRSGVLYATATDVNTGDSVTVLYDCVP